MKVTPYPKQFQTRDMECCKQRPNRSDIHLSAEDEARIEAETRDQFDDLAPKRHSKPQRSEYSTSYVDANAAPQLIPEHLEFQRLEGHQEKLVYSSGQATDEFVETDYYKDLNLVDKQHHTTGTGFIKMEDVKGDIDKYYETECHTANCSNGACHGNPATNDWIPASTDEVDLVSGKPRRSDI